jgi:uncharacterized protein (TIGR02145 family)
LATEAEWEYAARGPEGTSFPWGGEFDCSGGNFWDEYSGCDDGFPEGPAPVGSFPDGASWCGVLDLAGNVWEWVADRFAEYASEDLVNPKGPAGGDQYILRGGSWGYGPAFVRSAYRYAVPPSADYLAVGFRCVVEAPAGAVQTGTVSDVDGNVYGTVGLGEQWWMAENLRVTRDPGGNPITSLCYDEDEGNCEMYGRLYTWDAAMAGSAEEGAQGICPQGWRVPSDTDWTRLFEFLGGIDVAGGKMKEAGTAHWFAPNTAATGESGFAGLPAGGYTASHGIFEGLGIGGHFWSSTEAGADAGLPTLHKDLPEVLWLTESKTLAVSVRCVKSD